MNIAVLVPVKELGQAKSRLAALLAPEERRRLATLMLEGVLAQVARLPPRFGRVLVSSYPPALALGRAAGFETLIEGRQRSESASVDEASAELARRGVTGVLRLPLDLPNLEADDLLEVLALAEEGHEAVLVPSRDGSGTNGLYRAPATLFASRFGAGSLALHEEAARHSARRWRVLALQSLALDVDDPGDVEEVLRVGRTGPVLAYLHEIGVAARLAGMRRQGA